ncbi:MOB kinase activator-like 3 [Chionoecetes opilio]|uniref:MOB kinase activator-like 3 n=1 Tax=Chionoecetes opilio TaxID=41210 RepID=A0A8J4YIQ6_CHIOP|nr:MOB kinase activator-like 3 [Chionoecetes opilio]
MALTDVNTTPFPLPLSAAKRLIPWVCRSTWNNTLGDALRITSMGQYRSDSSPQPWIRKKSRVMDCSPGPRGTNTYIPSPSSREVTALKAHRLFPEPDSLDKKLLLQTFRPKKKFEPGTLKYSLHKQAQASLSSGINLRSVVSLPPGEDLNDWIAVHVVDFFNRINLIYGTVCEYCTQASCPTMSGGQKFEYRWADGAKYKKPTALPAPQYVSLLMDWVEGQINDEHVFPVTVEICDGPVTIFSDVPFPKAFIPLCKKILTRLFRVFVHVYIHHFDRIVAIGAEAHVNTCYKHFYYFIMEFDLVRQNELEPLKEMTNKICHDGPEPPNEPRK